MIKCIGTNDNKLNHAVFQSLFRLECESLGQIIGIVDMGHTMLAQVLER